MTAMWQVYTTWQGIFETGLERYVAQETCAEYSTWAQARTYALKTACLSGTRYISVQRPDAVIAGEYDRITNRWRQYPRTLVDVEHTTEVTNDNRMSSAWCTCGWSKYAPISGKPGSSESADQISEDRAQAHRDTPAEC